MILILHEQLTSFTIPYLIHYVFLSFSRRKWPFLNWIFSIDLHHFSQEGFSIFKGITFSPPSPPQLDIKSMNLLFYLLSQTKIKLNGFFPALRCLKRQQQNPFLVRIISASIVKMKTNGKSFSFFLMNKFTSLVMRCYLDSRFIFQLMVDSCMILHRGKLNYSKDEEGSFELSANIGFILITKVPSLF